MSLTVVRRRAVVLSCVLALAMASGCGSDVQGESSNDCADLHKPLAWWRAYESPHHRDAIRTIENEPDSVTWEVPSGRDGVRTVVLTRVDGSDLWDNTGLACQ